MASIVQIGQRWRALVRRKGHAALCRTFGTKREAEAWAKQIESSMDAVAADVNEGMLTSTMLSEYRRMRGELGRPVAAETNTHYMLTHLSDDLGDVRVADLTPQRLVAWARMRSEQGAGGYTVNMELSALGTAIRHTASFLGVSLPDVVGAARPLLHYSQLIGGGARRTRRPTEDELTRLLDYLQGVSEVVADAVRVAAITGLRRGEIVRIAWADVDAERRAVLVRQRKHPRRVLARDEWVPLLGESWGIVQRQPRVKPQIFVVSAEKLTDSVTAATRALGIPDLRLHDLRREATSALRDMGFDADARKAVTGHRSDEMHSRYVAVSMESLHAAYDAAQDKRPRRSRQPPKPDPQT